MQQSSSTCTYAVKPLEIEVDEELGSEKVEVDAPLLCAWSAVSNVPWIRIAFGALGIGRGEVRFVIDPLPTNGTRKGTLTVAGRTVEVTQKRN